MISNVSVLKKAFDNFDREKHGSIPCEMVGSILRLMGQACNDKILKELIREIDSEGNVFSCLKNMRMNCENLRSLNGRIGPIGL